jgi:hypothetical protein
MTAGPLLISIKKGTRRRREFHDYVSVSSGPSPFSLHLYSRDSHTHTHTHSVATGETKKVNRFLDQRLHHEVEEAVGSAAALQKRAGREAADKKRGIEVHTIHTTHTRSQPSIMLWGCDELVAHVPAVPT